jgi:hypothetical protein
MARLLGIVVTLLLGSLAVAAPALAVTSVAYQPTVTGDFGHGSLLTITGDDTDALHLNDNIRITETADGYLIERLDLGGQLTTQNAECGGPVTDTVISCAPAVDGLSIDLRAGNDRLTTSGVITPMEVAGGSENDFIQGGFGPDVLTGGDGIDTLIGRGGLDEFFGEGGNDTIDSRDGIAERISCGTGNDTVDNDFTDIIAECERGTDTDGDGFSTAVDCNDSAANVFPGAPEILENGVDENCNGVDDRNLDRDGDGFPLPGDCNDADPAIHPGAIEIRGNTVDENCDRRAESFAVLPSLVSATWRLTGHNTKLRKLVVRNAPKDARIVLTCKGPGCTFKKAKRLVVRRDLDPVGLDRFFGGTKTLRPRATVKVVVTAPQAVGRSYTWRIKKDEVPASSIDCIAPGATKGRPC